MDFEGRPWYSLFGSDGVRMVRKTDISDAAASVEPNTEPPVSARRAVLKAAASTPVILTLMAGPAHAHEYDGDGNYICTYFPAEPPADPNPNPNACPDTNPGN
jgi:hypothetical protein